MTTAVRAAGGVLWRREGDRVEVAVVHRPKYDDWSLPKGKLDAGETSVAAAVREVAEETGFRVVVGRSLGTSHYRVLDRGRDAPKSVRWWAMQAVDGEFVPDAEVDRLDWLPVPQALSRVTAGRDDGVLEAFTSCPPETSTVLLVRHGSAGSREHWDGEDAARPLDARGRSQAAALADLLPLWAPQEVLAAPPERCVQTVRPTADRLGLDVQRDGALAESAAAALPDRLRALGGAGRTVVACSQGRTIPGGVTAVAQDAGLAVGDVEVPKASVWALTFSAGRLVDADLLRSPLGP